jgi:hypothetical protein
VSGDDDYGTVRIGGRLYRMNGRGYLLYLLGGSVLLVGAVWVCLVLIIFAFSPLYG